MTEFEWGGKKVHCEVTTTKTAHLCLFPFVPLTVTPMWYRIVMFHFGRISLFWNASVGMADVLEFQVNFIFFFMSKSYISQNHIMGWVGRDLKNHSVPTLHHGQDCHSLDQGAHGPILPGHRCLQGWMHKTKPTLCLFSVEQTGALQFLRFWGSRSHILWEQKWSMALTSCCFSLHPSSCSEKGHHRRIKKQRGRQSLTKRLGD